MNQPANEAKRAAALRPASTLLLLREDSGRLEVLMMRRPSTMAFMADAWVFPGGGQDAADSAPAILARTGGTAAARHCRLCAVGGEPLEADEALSLMVTACRETFEEAGVLLAKRSDDSAPSAEVRARALARRVEVTEQPLKLAEFLESEGLFLDVERLVYWSHWITPPFENRRFDTRFFATGLSGGHVEVSGTRESTELEWLEPAAVLEAQQRGEMKVMPPTVITLEDLELSYRAHGSVTAMLEAELQRATPPLMPKLFVQGEIVNAVMPWDAAYPSLPGEGFNQAAASPGHYSRLRSRFEFRRPARPK